MKRIVNHINQHSARIARRVAIAATIVASLAITSSALAYGPSRSTYTIEHPADKITFNSITDNPSYGDERNFALIKDATHTASGGWTDEVTVEDGKEYLIRVYVHNNAGSNLGLVAQNTRVSVLVPTTTGNSVTVAANVLADNADPKQIWDEVTLKGNTQFNIAYIAGSARYYNNINPGTGFALSDSIVTNAGAPVGYEQMDGKVPGCFQYSGIATFKVKAQAMKTPNFTVEKKVRLNGTTEWKKSVTAQPGQKVDYQIGYKNTGEAWQNDVIVKDKLPAGVSYSASTTTLKNASNPTGDGLKLNSNEVVNDGINIGNYAPPANAFVRFTATLPANDKLEICGTNKLINTATVATEHGSKSDTAEVIVEKTNCGPRECKAGIPEGDERCTTAAKVTELPQTGPLELIGTLVALMTLTTAFIYWYRSREHLKVHGVADSAGSIVENVAATITKPAKHLHKDITHKQHGDKH